MATTLSVSERFGHPSGLATLFFVEMWERFSYYGMRALLTLFMVAPQSDGGLGLSVGEAALIYGNYTMAVYLLSVPGGFLADRFIGAYRAVAIGGVIIALGHFSMAVPTQLSFFVGLCLIALGTGLFKPNISALVGTLYEREDTRRDAGFSIFYMGINIGAFIAPFVTGFLAQSPIFKSWLSAQGLDPHISWHWGFGAAGVGMAIAVILFFFVQSPSRFEPARVAQKTVDYDAIWMGVLVVIGSGLLMAALLASDLPEFMWLRYLLVALPLVAILYFARAEDLELKRLGAIFVFFIAAMVFWAAFEQAGLSIALVADRLTDNRIFDWVFPSAWYQSLNPLFVIALAPVAAALWVKLGARQPSTPVKFALGLFLLASAFMLLVPAAHLTSAGKISPWWLVGFFLLQTAGELLLSPVGLSAMTRLAPARMVGLVLGVWFLAAAFGNKLAGILGAGFSSEDPIALASFFTNLALMTGGTAACMIVLLPWLKSLMGDVR